MARKKIEPITNLGNEDKLTVQKSRPLFALWRSELTLAEFKILDTYLSRIDSHNPDKRTVIFEKGELEQILGVKRIRTEELDDRLKHLGTPIKIEDKTSKNKKFSRISLFEKSVAEQDDNGLWQIELTASPSAMKYFFNIDNLGYLKYKLRCITSLSSRYTYIMFLYLESNRRRKSWEVPLDELKEILNCENEETYKEYKHFNNLLLKKIQKEMHKKTECKYRYEPIKKGKKVIAIKFTLETLMDILLNTKQEEIISTDVDEKELQYSQALRFLARAVDFEFSEAELIVLKDFVLQLFPTNELEQYNYLKRQWNILNLHSKKTIIKNRFAYLKKLLENEEQKRQEQLLTKQKETNDRLNHRFNQFPQRNYTKEDYAEIERKLLKR